MQTIAEDPGLSGRDEVGHPPAEQPTLPPPPVPRPAVALASRASRSAFRWLNRLFAVPVHRAGLAAWLGTPLTGCQLLLTTTGRRSGLPRFTPLGYIVAEGSAWVLAGYGPSTLWFRNLLVEPRVTVRLPARRPFDAIAEPVDDPEVRARIIPALVRSMSLPGFSIGTNVLTASDERILELVCWVPLVRLTPEGPALVAGPDDPGGRGWVWRQTAVALAVLAGLLVLRRRPRRGRGRARAER